LSASGTSRAGVPDDQPHPVAVALGLDPEPRVRVGVGGGVVDQRFQRVADQPAVDRRQHGTLGNGHLPITSRRHLAGVRRQGGQVDLLGGRAVVVRGEPLEQCEVLVRSTEAARAVAQQAHRALPLGARRGHGPVAEQLHAVEHRGERGAQLVHDGEEEVGREALDAEAHARRGARGSPVVELDLELGCIDDASLVGRGHGIVPRGRRVARDPPPGIPRYPCRRVGAAGPVGAPTQVRIRPR